MKAYLTQIDKSDKGTQTTDVGPSSLYSSQVGIDEENYVLGHSQSDDGNKKVDSDL